jgi:hypothetical protein
MSRIILNEESILKDRKNFQEYPEGFLRLHLSAAKIGDIVFCKEYGYGEVEATDAGQWKSDLLINWKNCEWSGRFCGSGHSPTSPFRVTEGLLHNRTRAYKVDEIFLERFDSISCGVKLVNGVEIPDISVTTEEYHINRIYYPDVFYDQFYNYDTRPFCGSSKMIIYEKQGLLYPPTEQGKQAAILHAKAMLGIKET